MKPLLVVLVLLLGLLLLADRLAVELAEDAVAGEVAEKGALRGTPEVEIAGFPFLSQALAGRYDDVRVELTAEQLGRPDGTHADLVLRGVEV